MVELIILPNVSKHVEDDNFEDDQKEDHNIRKVDKKEMLGTVHLMKNEH